MKAKQKKETKYVGLHVPMKLYDALKSKASESLRPLSRECMAALYDRAGMKPENV